MRSRAMLEVQRRGILSLFQALPRACSQLDRCSGSFCGVRQGLWGSSAVSRPQPIIAHLNPLDCWINGKAIVLTLGPVFLQQCAIIILNLRGQSLEIRWHWWRCNQRAPIFRFNAHGPAPGIWVWGLPSKTLHISLLLLVPLLPLRLRSI